jgi:ubiquinone/menaquinone biosynthesis C-methylase UbiE
MNEQGNITPEGVIPAEEMYNKYARYYDIMTGRHTEDLPMYEQITATMPAPYLEVGCGTGRVLSRLIDQKPETVQGHYLTGVDVSAEMLAICESKMSKSIADGSLQIVKHDFSFSPLKGQKFNAAFVTFMLYPRNRTVG